jgi:hypothetical protein
MGLRSFKILGCFFCGAFFPTSMVFLVGPPVLIEKKTIFKWYRGWHPESQHSWAFTHEMRNFCQPWDSEGLPCVILENDMAWSDQIHTCKQNYPEY